MNNIVACVLTVGGGTYTEEYVNALAQACRRNLTVEYKFICLTDSVNTFSNAVDVVIPLNHGFPKWWGKMELFNQPLFAENKVLFLDLDTVIVDNIDFVFSYTPLRLTALEDFYFEENLGSGIMYYIGGRYDFIYTNFMKSPMSVIRNTPTGDQTWIKDNLERYDRLQHIFPKKFVSFKSHCAKNRNYKVGDPIAIPEGASVICFHGYPKPHDINHPMISNNWFST